MSYDSPISLGIAILFFAGGFTGIGVLIGTLWNATRATDD